MDTKVPVKSQHIIPGRGRIGNVLMGLSLIDEMRPLGAISECGALGRRLVDGGHLFLPRSTAPNVS